MVCDARWLMVQFENPDLLHLLWLVPIQAILLWTYWRWRRGKLKRLGSPALEERLLQGFSAPRFWLKNGLFAAGLALVVLSIANPIRQVKKQGKSRNAADVLIALDISQSMLARDARPSRLEQAKTFIRELVKNLDGERIGLLFFAGDAYPQAPLSTDYDALLMFARNAQPDFITDQGTDLAAAIVLAERMFEGKAEAGRALIILSDGEDHVYEAVGRARQAKAEGLRIHTVSFGTPNGASIPLGSDYKRDFTGAIVKTKNNDAFLKEIAQSGGGIFLADAEPSESTRRLRTEVDRLQKSAVESRAYVDYVTYYQWFLLPALLLLGWEQILWWRKRKLV